MILVGTMMIGALSQIDWREPTDAIPAFLTLVMMPLSFSITEGIAFGVIAHALLKTVAGRRRDVHALMHVFALLFLARYILLR